VSAARPRNLSCERCGGPVAFQAPFCGYCRAPIHWSPLLDIEPAGDFAALDLREQALPGEQGLAKVISAGPEGRLLTINGTAAYSGTLPKALRDACVSIRAVCFEPSCGFGVIGRVQKTGTASSSYSLMVHPAVRAYRVQRLLVTKHRTHVEALHDWEVVPAVGGLGVVNHVELRYADSAFQVVINGVKVASLVDARFGFGAVGWRATSYGEIPQRKRILFRSLEVRWVA
jgi:hypothetical protein